MTTLDTPTPPAAAPIWNTVLRYGGISGGAMVLLSLLFYVTDIDVFSLTGVALLYAALFAIGFVLAAMAMRHQRDNLNGGFISYGKAFLIGLLVVMFGSLISGLWNFVLVNFIDPDYMNVLKDRFVETWGERMPEDAMKNALAEFEKAGDIGTNLLNGVKGGAFMGIIVSLITAAFVKRNPEDTLK